MANNASQHPKLGTTVIVDGESVTITDTVAHAVCAGTVDDSLFDNGDGYIGLTDTGGFRLLTPRMLTGAIA